jgi:hypothetical protein
MKHFLLVAATILLFTSCQKEFKDVTVTPGGGGTGGGGTGSSTGNLMVKAVSIAGTDTTVVNLKYDANKKLIQHLVSGKSNGIPVDSKSDFVRDANGNIKKVVTIPANTMGLIDSIVGVVTYQPGTSRFAYVINKNYNSFITLRDSTVFTYNAAGKVTVTEQFLENFLTGLWEKQFKTTYAYDALSNLTTVVAYSPDASGTYTVGSTTTNTYDSHLSPLTLNEEVFLMSGIGLEVLSVNHIITKTINGSGQSGVFTFSQTQYNSFNRPVSETLTATGTVALTAKTTYFYQ